MLLPPLTLGVLIWQELLCPAHERAYSDCSSHRKQLGHQAQPRGRYDEQGWGTVNTHRQKQSKSSSAMRKHVSHSTADLIIGCLRRCVYTMTVPTGPRYEYSGASSSWIGGPNLMAQRPLKPRAIVGRVKRLGRGTGVPRAKLFHPSRAGTLAPPHSP